MIPFDSLSIRLLRIGALSILLFSHSPIELQAQIKPSRTVFTEPLDVRTDPGVAADAWFAAEAVRGWGSYQDEQAWQYRLHGYIEPYRFGDDSTAMFTTSFNFHHELTASPHNDLGFDPRTARWEESLLFHARIAPFTLQTGWFHRCKHEIDDVQRRTLIISGPTVIGVTPTIETPLGAIRIQGGAEYYVVREDYRDSAAPRTGSWEDLRGAIWLRGEARWPLGERSRLSGSYYISFPFFDSRNGAPEDIVVAHEAHAELALTFFSKRTAISIIVGADHTWDEVALVTAEPTTSLQAGLRVGL
ncbi:MAG: hypothetical protein EHM43_04975 [Ignavibacteriae bacterium]|nr:MAG: hypothetical protein EHM43_04975 [Ignavibacteriota bacterium]